MGFLRFLLAFFVAYQHLAGGKYLGIISVFGFFTLSGFLITLITNEVYNDGLRGKGMFLLNRFLRIYPTYWACLVLAVCFLSLAPDEGLRLTNDMALPTTGWLRQIVIYGLQHFDSTKELPSPMPLTWSLNVELAYYLLIGLFIGKSRSLCLIWFVCSLGYLGWCVFNDVRFSQIYFSFFGASIDFATGSLAYHFRQHMPRWRWGGCPLLLALTAVFITAPSILNSEVAHVRIYCFILVPWFAYAIVSIYTLYEESKQGFLGKLERWCGKISYPFFLLHWPAAALLVHSVLQSDVNSPYIFSLTALFTIFLSVIVVCSVEWPLERWRRRIRNNSLTKK